MVSVIETLRQIEAVCPPSAFRDALMRHREGIFIELPEQFVMRIARASDVFVEHFPKDEADWEPWHHRAAAMFKQAQLKWMQEQGTKP